MTKQEKIEQRYAWIAEQLRKKGWPEQAIEWDMKCIRNRDFGTALSDTACAVITSSEILELFPTLPTVVGGF